MDNQIYRWRDRSMIIWTDRQKDREMNVIDLQMDRQIQRWIDRSIDGQVDLQIDRQIYRWIDRQIY